MLHFVFQTALHLDAPYIAAAVLFWTGYLVYRLRAPEQARAWGLRSDTFATSLKANGVLLLIGGAAMVGFGLSHGRGWPNLWVHGFSHGWLASLAYIYVLGEDPLAAVRQMFNV